MKKTILIAATIFALGALTQAIFGIVRYMKGDKVAVYPRFMKKEGDDTKFNWWSLLSPIQTETQKKVYDSTKFSQKVIYPVASHFSLVIPADSTSEQYVAQSIAKVINDSLNKIKFRLKFDYDDQAIGVRKAANPRTVKLQQPKVSLSLFGTASPEALKYGLEKSLQPGALELENANLAEERLKRTGALLQKNLALLKVGSVTILNQRSEELQLPSKDDVKKVMANKQLLNPMRYVKADVTISVEKLEVTPITTPIALPLWLIGLAGLLFLLINKKYQQRAKEETSSKAPKKFNWDFLWKVFLGIVTISAIILGFAIVASLPRELIAWIMIFLAMAYAVFVIYLYLRYLRNADWNGFFMRLFRLLAGIPMFIWNLLQLIFWIIVLFFVFIGIAFKELWQRFRRWWRMRCDCCKILMVVLLLHIIYDVLHFGFHII